jgi:hypothetical protein
VRVGRGVLEDLLDVVQVGAEDLGRVVEVRVDGVNGGILDSNYLELAAEDVETDALGGGTCQLWR